MFVSSIKTEFYDVVSGNRVLLLAACDLDALCTCKILQYLFKCDNILYTLIPVHGQESLIRSYAKYKSQARYVILINCGACIDVIECLQPDENVIFFIFDSHRPVNIYNVYSESQIRLLMKSDDCEDIPAYDDVFKDEESEDEEDETGRISEATLIRRRRRRLWEENREKILFDYYQTTYFGEPSSLLVFDLAWKMSRDNNDLLWLAILGLTEQYVMKRIEQDKYVLTATSMQSHLSRHNRVENGLNSISCMKISFEKDLNLVLYRHWALYESMRNSQHIACKFKLWSFKGQRKFHQYLVHIGLPLSEVKQQFAYMKRDFRNNVCTLMEDGAEEYGLDQIVYGAFISHFGFGRKLSATDVVYSIKAILESTDKEKTHADKFLDALDTLNRCEYKALESGIENAKIRMIAITEQVQQFINMKRVINAGPFLYSVVSDSTKDVRHFSRPECLLLLAHFLLEAHVNNSKKRTVHSLPLILFAMDDVDPEQCLLVGIPPLSQQSPKNFLGKAFEQAAKQRNIPIFQDLFCPTFAYINKNHQGKFLESLYFLLS